MLAAPFSFRGAVVTLEADRLRWQRGDASWEGYLWSACISQSATGAPDVRASGAADTLQEASARAVASVPGLAAHLRLVRRAIAATATKGRFTTRKS